MNKRRWIAVAAVLAAVAVGFVGGWLARRQTTTASHHGAAYGKALVSGQLLLGDDPHHSEPLATGSVGLANIYQTGPVSPTIDVWSDGGFSTYVEPGTYTVFGVSPDYHDGTKACTPYQVPNGTISVRAGDRISVALLCR